MKEDNMEFLLDDKKLKKVYKRAKFMSTIRTIMIVILVTIPLYVTFNKINVRVTYKIGTQYYEEIKKILEVTEPHAYVSKANDTIGFFGAVGQYTVSKEVGLKSVELYNENSSYGLVDIIEPNRFSMIEIRGGGCNSGEWPVSFDRSGNLTMMAFHPDIKYKEYKNDIALLNKISSDSLLEMTLSFDKKYKVNEISDILPSSQISELLIDGYTDEQMKDYKRKASAYDGKATFIQEYYFIRLAVSRRFNFDAIGEVSDNYKKFLDNLQFNFKIPYDKNRFNSIYSALKAKTELQANKLDIIGVVVYGNPEQLKQLKSNPHIKASSVGVITKDIVFK